MFNLVKNAQNEDNTFNMGPAFVLQSSFFAPKASHTRQANDFIKRPKHLTGLCFSSSI